MELEILGCRIKIEFTFFLMLSFAALLNAEDIMQLLLFASLHELGHLVCLVLFGGRPYALTLSFYGLALRYDSQLNRARETVVLLAGPAVNLLFYIILGDDINLLLFLLNMQPIYPLDFGRVLRLYFPRLSAAVSIIFLLLLAAAALYLIIFYKSFSLIFIVCYLLVYTVFY